MDDSQERAPLGRCRSWPAIGVLLDACVSTQYSFFFAASPVFPCLFVCLSLSLSRNLSCPPHVSLAKLSRTKKNARRDFCPFASSVFGSPSLLPCTSYLEPEPSLPTFFRLVCLFVCRFESRTLSSPPPDYSVLPANHPAARSHICLIAVADSPEPLSAAAPTCFCLGGTRFYRSDLLRYHDIYRDSQS